MKQALSAPVRLWHLLVVGVLVVALSSTIAVSAAPNSPAFAPQGTIRMAFAANSNLTTITKGYVNYPVLKATISIPAGKVADIAVLGAVDIEGGALTGNMYCFGYYALDNLNTGIRLQPNGTAETILMGVNPPPNNLTVPLNGWLTKVPAGTHTVIMGMSAGYADCYPQYRQMVVIANIH